MVMKKCAVLLAVLALVAGSFAQSGQKGSEKRHVILLGASVGRAWDFQSLPQRTGLEGYEFRYIPRGGFDKSRVLQEILAGEENIPDAVIIKECAAYFPGDFDRYKVLVREWAGICSIKGVIPVLATVVPVTRLHSFKKILIDLIKGRGFLDDGNPFEHNRNAAIVAYNDWVKNFAAEKGLPVLDMEAAVVYGPENRFLREDLAKLDGLHLNAKAYLRLDDMAASMVRKINWDFSKKK